MQQYKQILKAIKKHDEIVIARHVGPDPDAIASQIALRDLIKLNFPNKKVYAVGASVARFKYFGSLDKINESELNNPLLIITDVPEFDRVDGINKSKYNMTIKIDHHPCQTEPCNINLVDPASSSACELIADFALNTKLKLNKEIASTLYMGIISDSDRFLLSYTSPRTLMVSAMLLNEYKFDIMPLYNNLYERPLSERKFEGYLINNITVTDEGLGYMIIPLEKIKEFGVDVGTASNMINDFNFIKELKVWAFATYDEKNSLYKVNIRSRKITINTVAEKFNGGGHKFASGARPKTEEEVNALFKALNQAIIDEEKIID